ncbi:hypothetical protein GBA52_004515 [Prunus armeniaca]|nr:hypothetical protein GBA52_004515 [Prunus armeniaca]
MADCNRGEDYEASTVVQKYGGLAPKKKPLISKDHERAFFDSADWALCKQGAGVNPKSTAAVETLRPKLQLTIKKVILICRERHTSSSLQGDLPGAYRLIEGSKVLSLEHLTTLRREIPLD